MCIHKYIYLTHVTAKSWSVECEIMCMGELILVGSLNVSSILPFPDSNQKLVKRHIQFRTYFSSSSDLLCCSALAKAMAPVAVRLLCLRLYWEKNALTSLDSNNFKNNSELWAYLYAAKYHKIGLNIGASQSSFLPAHIAQFFTIMVPGHFVQNE